MSFNRLNEFYWVQWDKIDGDEGELVSDQEKYQRLIQWARQARGRNPGVFDSLTEWILDDSEWDEDKLVENESLFMQGVLAGFRKQNADLRAYLKKLEPSGLVNEAVWSALDCFDSDLTAPMGYPHDEQMREAVERVFSDFSAMRERSVREVIAGNKTGNYGTDSVDIFGYMNHLKNCDAQVQWCLFMPDMVNHQLDGFLLDRFDYQTMPVMRFIGIEVDDDPGNTESAEKMASDFRTTLYHTLDDMAEYGSGFDYDILFQNHYGKGVDIERWHGFWGRFMKADSPVPEGFVYWDFVPDDSDTPYLTFRSQFAFAVFSGDVDAVHNDEGTDGGRMYDIPRNIILSQGVTIPYPELYWTAEVFLEGYAKPSTAYLFSVVL